MCNGSEDFFIFHAATYQDEELVKKNILCNKKRITGYRNKHDERVMKNVMMNV